MTDRCATYITRSIVIFMVGVMIACIISLWTPTITRHELNCGPIKPGQACYQIG